MVNSPSKVSQLAGRMKLMDGRYATERYLSNKTVKNEEPLRRNEGRLSTVLERVNSDMRSSLFAMMDRQ